MTISAAPVEELCRRALGGHVLSEDEVWRLLEARGDAAQAVFRAAREIRRRHHGDVVFLYGFVYFSTFCRNRCTFCLYRAGNPESPRYRKTVDEVVATCRGLATSGVVLLDLTMGEDPALHNEPGYATLLDLVAAVSDATDLPLMISPGLLPEPALRALRARGAAWYALYQEAHRPELYAGLRSGQPYAARVAARAAARRGGLLVEDGILTGIGDTAADRAHSIVAMRSAGWEQVRVMTFVPQRGTPLATAAAPDYDAELLTIAVMRLTMPERFIPASLDVAGLAGLEARLNAGANIVTSLVPPHSGLLGVSQAELGVDEGERTVASVRPRLAALGLRAGSAEEYRERLRRLAGRSVAATQ